jgi:hypothetical protein
MNAHIFSFFTKHVKADSSAQRKFAGSYSKAGFGGRTELVGGGCGPALPARRP